MHSQNEILQFAKIPVVSLGVAVRAGGPTAAIQLGLGSGGPVTVPLLNFFPSLAATLRVTGARLRNGCSTI
jgi:hypothetical protein